MIKKVSREFQNFGVLSPLSASGKETGCCYHSHREEIGKTQTTVKKYVIAKSGSKKIDFLMIHAAARTLFLDLLWSLYTIG